MVDLECYFLLLKIHKEKRGESRFELDIKITVGSRNDRKNQNLPDKSFRVEKR